MATSSTGVETNEDGLNLSPKEMQELRSLVSDSKDFRETGPPKPATSNPPISRARRDSSNTDPGFVSLNWLMNTDDDDLEESRAACFKFCCQRFKSRNLKSKSAIAAILAWDSKHCRNLEDFQELMELVTRRAEETIEGFDVILAKLSFLQASDPALRKLSVVGGYLWMITYAMQHVALQATEQYPPPDSSTDEDVQFHPNPLLNTKLLETHGAYEEIGKVAQEWVPDAFNFLQRVRDLRKDTLELVETLQQRFRFPTNPFKVAAASDGTESEVPRLFTTSAPSKVTREENVIERRGLQNESLKVQWSSVVVLVQATPEVDSSWEVFSSLSPAERIELVAMFIQEALRLLNSCLKSHKRSMSSSDSIEQPETTRSSSIMEVVCGLLHFCSSTKFRKMKLIEPQLTHLGKAVEKLWFVIVKLHDTTFQVSKLVTETRDIVRSCYVYSDNFYHWNLRSFDSFGPVRVQSAEQEQRIKKFMTRIVGERNEVVDVVKFFSIADFSTSHYQFVLQHNPISSHGISMKLECWDEDTNEPNALIDNTVDRRRMKEVTATRTSTPHDKPKRFIITYENSDTQLTIKKKESKK